MNKEIKMFKTEMLDEYLIKNKMSKTKFCKLAQLGTKTLKRVYEQDLKLRISVVQRIAIVMEIKPSTFLVDD